MDETRRITTRPQKDWAPVPQGDPDARRSGMLRTIWSGRWIIALVTVVSLAAGAVYLTQAIPTYTSTSRLYVEQTGPKIITDSEGVMTQSKNYLYTQCELLKSTPILSSALSEPGIREMKVFGTVDNPVAHLKLNLDVEVGKKDDLISISFDSADPTEAARLVNSIVDAYVTYHSQQKRSEAGTVLRILQNEKAKRDAELTAKLEATLKFKQENASLSFEGDKGNIINQSLERLSEALTEAQLERIEAKVACSVAEAVADEPLMVRSLFESQRSTALPGAFYNEDSRLRTDLNRMQLDLISLKAECTDDHPAVKTVQTKIDTLKRELAARQEQLARAGLAVARERYRAAERKETEIRGIFDAQQEVAHQLNAKAAQYAVLESDLKRTEKLCDILDSRIKELNVTEDTGALNISILEVAAVEDEPSSPKKGRVLALAIAAGLGLGTLLVLVRDETDQRFRSSAEISSGLGIPILGSVPSLSGKGSVVTRGRTVILDPASSAAEAYRAIRTAAYFGTPEGKTKTILITSPLQGEGKTTLVSNLAIAMAQAGQLTLVIDADFRKPMQHEIFEVPLRPGLSDLLGGEGSLDDAIRRTSIDGPDVLTCGPIPGNPSEVLNSSEFRRILRELSKTYDRILLDSPPVIPVTDPSILAATCDATLLVLKAEKSTRKAAQQACDRLLSVGADILGVIVNAVPQGHDRYGYYGYGYGYHRKDDEREEAQSPGWVAAAVGEQDENELGREDS